MNYVASHYLILRRITLLGDDEEFDDGDEPLADDDTDDDGDLNGRFRTTTQTTMTISAVEVGFEVRCFLRLRSQRDVAFRLTSRDVTCHATGLVPDRR